ncbi:type I restriction endonuclease subunit R [Moraxella sp. ZJ142]|uniref:type I restriction endonuclease subunit R n=1 Tax=Moraxella marmotae TaxID=3344520 RepID=UPI0035D49AE7
MKSLITEQDLENATMDSLAQLGWRCLHGEDTLSEHNAWRADSKQVVLRPILTDAVARLNPTLPPEVVSEVVNTVCRTDIKALDEQNHQAYELIKQGVRVSYTADGQEHSVFARLVDFQQMANNQFHAINQFTIKGIREHRPDVMLFVNGLAVGIMELKSPTKTSASISHAYQQIQTYKDYIADAFIYNQIIIISDGVQARLGSLTADYDRFTPWRVVDESRHAKAVFDYELDALLDSLLSPQVLMDYIQNFITFERNTQGRLIKKIAAYHQYYGVNQAVQCTLTAQHRKDGKIGVVWHTQGSGKSLSMLFYAAKVLAQPELANPTIVVVTDRNDLDGQLFATFSTGKQMIRQEPVQADGRDALRDELSRRETGGVIFTTIQKFGLHDDETRHPVLNERQNIIVITDEAHRSQYGFGQILNNKGKYRFGYAKHLRDALPNASFIGFTGTPISLDDKDTQSVFGEYVSIYDIHDAVEDGATVPIIYEARQIKLAQSDDFAKIMEQIKQLEAEQDDDGDQKALRLREQLMGADSRLQELAADFIAHFEQRISLSDGKAMFVASSREICVKLYNEIIKRRPDWHSDNINEGQIKIVMTGSASDDSHLQKHIYGSQDKKTLEKRFKDPNDNLKIVIVRDMWLTGFDAPCCHTMYIDKPMQGHNLMQAIARVNRVFKNKSRDNGGLIVDYVGLSEELKNATRQYTNSGGSGTVTQDLDQIFAKMVDWIDTIRNQFATPVDGRAFDLDHALSLDDAKALMAAVMAAANHIIALDRVYHNAQSSNTAHAPHHTPSTPKEPTPRKNAFLQAIRLAKKGYTLCGAMSQIKPYQKQLAFFDAVRATIVKHSTKGGQKRQDSEKLIRLQLLVNQAIISDGAVDLFALADQENPNISILSDEFLEWVKGSPTPDLWVLAVEKYLDSQIKEKGSSNLGLKKAFIERLQNAMNQYHNHHLDTIRVLKELIEMGKAFSEQLKRGDELGLNPAEIAFYDALAQNGSAKDQMGDEILIAIAKEISRQLRKSVTVDWQYRESVRASMRLAVGRILRRFKYPPDGCETATEFVISQAEVLADELSQ